MTRPYVHCTPELFERLFVRIAAGETLTSLGADSALPSTSRMFVWLKAHPDLKARYDAACAQRTHVLRKRWPRKGGRREHKPLYSEDLAWRICEGVIRGQAVREVLAAPGMPPVATMYSWLDRYPEFARMFTWACHCRAEKLADEVVAIADRLDEPDPATEAWTPRTVRETRARDRLERAGLKRAKQMIAVRKQLYGSLTPKRYR